MNLDQRPDAYDWEVLADEDAEYAAWLDARAREDRRAIDAACVDEATSHAA